MRLKIPPIERSISIVAILIVLFATATFVGQEAVPSEIGNGETTVLAQATGEKAPEAKPDTQSVAGKSTDNDVSEDALSMSGVRIYETKMYARQLIRLVRWVIGILLAIAVVSALSLWMLARQRAMPRSDVSAEMATTLVAVEERQAKLASILKDIQQEIDYVHSMSVPDLKKLIEQAERYIEQNEKDLARASAAKKQAGSGEAAKPER